MSNRRSFLRLLGIGATAAAAMPALAKALPSTTKGAAYDVFPVHQINPRLHSQVRKGFDRADWKNYGGWVNLEKNQ